jgi:enoyl-CoA hydratase/carnithine racemase
MDGPAGASRIELVSAPRDVSISTMTYDAFEIERTGGVSTLWLANPRRKNAMGPAFWDELPRAMARSVTIPTRVVVLAARGGTSAGTRPPVDGQVDRRRRAYERRRATPARCRRSRGSSSITAVATAEARRRRLPQLVHRRRQTRHRLRHPRSIGLRAILGARDLLRSSPTWAAARRSRDRRARIAAELCLTGDDFDAERARTIVS